MEAVITQLLSKRGCWRGSKSGRFLLSQMLMARQGLALLFPWRWLEFSACLSPPSSLTSLLLLDSSPTAVHSSGTGTMLLGVLCVLTGPCQVSYKIKAT